MVLCEYSVIYIYIYIYIYICICNIVAIYDGDLRGDLRGRLARPMMYVHLRGHVRGTCAAAALTCAAQNRGPSNPRSSLYSYYSCLLPITYHLLLSLLPTPAYYSSSYPLPITPSPLRPTPSNSLPRNCRIPPEIAGHPPEILGMPT